MCLLSFDIEPLVLSVVVGLGGIDGCPRVVGDERYACMSSKQLFPLSNDYLCSLDLIYEHT